MERKYVGYCRVSTQAQGISGLGLQAQEESIRRFLNGGELIASYTDIESGRKADRPELARAIAHCKRNGAVLLIAKLDRLARNVAFISHMMESKVEFVCCDNPHATRLTLHILAAVAEAEAEMISQRTKAALQAAKARGVQLGCPENLTPDARCRGTIVSARAKNAQAKEEYAHLVPVIKQHRQEGLTFMEIAYRLNESGERTRRGALFLSATVQRILKRA